MQSKLKQIVLILLVVLSASCSKKVAGLKAFPEEEIKEGYTKATVVYSTVDGCNWLLQIENEKKVEPINLKEEFKKDKLKVWIKYVIKKGAVGICMAGEIVTLTEIELR